MHQIEWQWEYQQLHWGPDTLWTFQHQSMQSKLWPMGKEIFECTVVNTFGVNTANIVHSWQFSTTATNNGRPSVRAMNFNLWMEFSPMQQHTCAREDEAQQVKGHLNQCTGAESNRNTRNALGQNTSFRKCTEECRLVNSQQQFSMKSVCYTGLVHLFFTKHECRAAE